MEAVILAGGESWRMKPHFKLPKALVEIEEGETLLEWQVGWLLGHGFERIIVCANKVLMEDLDVLWSIEPEKLGTGGALKRALRMCTEDFVYVLNVDDIIIQNPLAIVMKVYHDDFQGVTIVVAEARLPYGLVKIERKGDIGKVLGFEEKPTLKDLYVSCGHYVWNRKLGLEYLPEKGDLERTALPRLAKEGLLRAYIFKGEWFTINTYKDVVRFRKWLRGEL